MDLAKYAINCKVIVKTNYYQTNMSKVSYLITTDIKISIYLGNTQQIAWIQEENLKSILR